MKKLLLLLVALMPLTTTAQLLTPSKKTVSSNDITPRTYEAAFTTEDIKVDGDINDAAWNAAKWTEEFVDIRGEDYPTQPKFRTRAKVLYSDTHVYFAFELMEPHLWGTITKRDETMYWDNDIEIFIDPDGDGRNYQEYEFNVLGTEWDLLLTEPQGRGGIHINNFDMAGMKTAVKHYGTVNDPSDTDEKWTFEVMMPIEGVLQSSYQKGKPMKEQVWRVNFSRVEWLKFEIVDGKYKKIEGTEAFGNEENWVWSPTGLVDMHRPELWGILTFEQK